MMFHNKNSTRHDRETGGAGHLHSQFLLFQTKSNLIIPEWTTSSLYGLIGAMLAAILTSILYECIHEYLRYLRHKALTKEKKSLCCGGVKYVTCCEKLVQTVLHVLRVIFGYFMMLCVMTMNVWLLIAVSVGAGVGYLVGKPIVANAIADSVTSHGYKVANINVQRNGNKVYQRSLSWRYQAISVHQKDNEMEFQELSNKSKQGKKGTELSENGNVDKNKSGSDVIWIRRSVAEADDTVTVTYNHETNPPDRDHVQIREQTEHTPQQDILSESITSRDSTTSRASGRFKSTSKVINQSFRSDGSPSVPRSMHKSVSLTSSRSSTLDEGDNSPRQSSKASRGKQRSSSKVSRSSSASMSRFKPVSKQIMRQQSFSDEI